MIIVDGVTYFESPRLRFDGATKFVPLYQGGEHLGFTEILESDERTEVVKLRPWIDYDPIAEDAKRRYAANPRHYAGD